MTVSESLAPATESIDVEWGNDLGVPAESAAASTTSPDPCVEPTGSGSSVEPCSPAQCVMNDPRPNLGAPAQAADTGLSAQEGGASASVSEANDSALPDNGPCSRPSALPSNDAAPARPDDCVAASAEGKPDAPTRGASEPVAMSGSPSVSPSFVLSHSPGYAAFLRVFSHEPTLPGVLALPSHAPQPTAKDAADTAPAPARIPVETVDSTGAPPPESAQVCTPDPLGPADPPPVRSEVPPAPASSPIVTGEQPSILSPAAALSSSLAALACPPSEPTLRGLAALPESADVPDGMPPAAPERSSAPQTAPEWANQVDAAALLEVAAAAPATDAAADASPVPDASEDPHAAPTLEPGAQSSACPPAPEAPSTSMCAELRPLAASPMDEPALPTPPPVLAIPPPPSPAPEAGQAETIAAGAPTPDTAAHETIAAAVAVAPAEVLPPSLLAVASAAEASLTASPDGLDGTSASASSLILPPPAASSHQPVIPSLAPALGQPTGTHTPPLYVVASARRTEDATRAEPSDAKPTATRPSQVPSNGEPATEPATASPLATRSTPSGRATPGSAAPSSAAAGPAARSPLSSQMGLRPAAVPTVGRAPALATAGSGSRASATSPQGSPGAAPQGLRRTTSPEPASSAVPPVSAGVSSGPASGGAASASGEAAPSPVVRDGVIASPVVTVGDQPNKRARRLPSRDATLPWVPSRTPPLHWADAVRGAAGVSEGDSDSGATASMSGYGSRAGTGTAGLPSGLPAGHAGAGVLSVSPVASTASTDLIDEFTPMPRFRRPGAVFWVIGAAIVGVFIVWGAVQATDRNWPAQQPPSAASGAAAIRAQDGLPPSGTEGASPGSAAAPRPGSSGQAAASADPAGAADASEMVTVELKIRPEGAQILYKGKPIGRTPYTIELPRGERRSLEVSAAGYTARKVVVDGTKPVISFVMKPLPREDEEQAQPQ